MTPPVDGEDLLLLLLHNGRHGYRLRTVVHGSPRTRLLALGGVGVGKCRHHGCCTGKGLLPNLKVRNNKSPLQLESCDVILKSFINFREPDVYLVAWLAATACHIRGVESCSGAHSDQRQPCMFCIGHTTAHCEQSDYYRASSAAFLWAPSNVVGMHSTKLVCCSRCEQDACRTISTWSIFLPEICCAYQAFTFCHATDGGIEKANPNQTEVLMGQQLMRNHCANKPLACTGPER